MWDIGKIFSRWILSTVNFIILVPSVGLLVTGLTLFLLPAHVTKILSQLADHCNIVEDKRDFLLTVLSSNILKELGLVVLVVSGLATIPALLGYSGAARLSRPCLVLYLVTLVSLWTCELLTLIVFPVAKSLLSHSLGFLLQQSLRLYKGSDDTNLASLVWDHAMVQLQCCGVYSYVDFSNSSLWITNKSSMQIVPGSCCKIDPSQYPVITPYDGHCIYVPTNYNSHWNKGCLDVLLQEVSEQVPVVMVTAIVLIMTQAVVIVTALCLLCLHSSKEKVRRDRRAGSLPA